MPKLAELALGLALALAVAPASAQVLYKWVDANGKAQYSDKPPTGFKGEVTRLEPPEPQKAGPSPAPRAMPKPPPAPDKVAPEPAPVDLATQRRTTRTLLGAQLARARENVDTAKKALAEAESPGDDERQVVQQRGAKGGMHGMAPRSNCRVETKDGRKVMMCPTAVPTPEYFDRVAKLEENLRKAEEDLAAAEQAWRRGVD